MKNIFVLGGAGFIGSATAKKLYKLKFNPIVIDNLSTGRKENLDKNIPFFKVDIGDQKKIEKLFIKFKPKYVFNFAFNVLVPKSIEDPTLEIKSIRDHLLILELSKKYSVKKMIFPSTGFIYGNIHKNKKIKENDKKSLENPYSIAKFSAEKFTIYYSKKFNLDYTILRYAAIYGPGQVTGAMSDYIRCAKKNIKCKFWGKSKTRDYVFIDDVVDANIKSLEKSSSNKIFNIGSGIATKLPDLYNDICKILKVRPKPIFYKEKIGEQDDYRLDSSYAYEKIRWKFSISLKNGLLKTIDHHIENNL